MRDAGDAITESGRIETRRILVLDPDAVYRVGLVELLLSRGFTPVACADTQGALKWLGRGSFVAIWSEYELDSPALDGIEFLGRARTRFPRASLVLASSSPRIAGLEAVVPSGARVFMKTEASAAIEFLMDRHGLEVTHARAATQTA